MIDFKCSFINDRNAVLRLIEDGKQNCVFPVIDVGASDNPWAGKLLDAVLDFKQSNLGVIHFQGNINEESGWVEVLKHVEKHGKFSFSICTHTLEDIAYPKIALEMLPKISHSGFIAVPSHYQDLSRIEGNWPGYIHHRWLFVPNGDELILIPKIPYTHNLMQSPPPTNRSELQIYWTKTIPYTILNGDYLGPNVGYVETMYKDILRTA